MNESRSVGVFNRLRKYTDARIGLETTGSSISTRDLLKFQSDWAQARDAVYYGVDFDLLASDLSTIGLTSVRVSSAAESRGVFLRRPDLGRSLSADSASHLSTVSNQKHDIAIIITDGLSGLAVDNHAIPLVRALENQINSKGWSTSPIILAEQGRVAIGDAIGEALSAKLTVMIIGERPGLSAADSLGVYITYDPQIGRNDSERNCVSNIRIGGLDPKQAAVTISYLISGAFKIRETGIALKDNSRVAIDSDGS